MSTTGVSCGSGKSPVYACYEGKGFRGGGSAEGGWFGDTATVLHSACTRRRFYPLERRTSGSAQTRGRRVGVVDSLMEHLYLPK